MNLQELFQILLFLSGIEIEFLIVYFIEQIRKTNIDSQLLVKYNLVMKKICFNFQMKVSFALAFCMTF